MRKEAEKKRLEEEQKQASEAQCPHLRKEAEKQQKQQQAAAESAAASGCPHMRREAEKARDPGSLTALEASEAAAVAAAESGDLALRNDLMKKHFTTAYNAMAEATASKPAMTNEKIAKVLVSKLGYTTAQLAVIGPDVVKMQGTGNPHLHANISKGDVVVDLGSGFGIDAFLAGAAVGPGGRVIGIDMSEREVVAAMRRAAERGAPFNVDFRLGDIEKVPVADGSADVVISNGGFCLVPDKLQAFREIHRILKPGGTYSISCTVNKKGPLPPGTKWPSCFHVFMSLPDAAHIIQTAGLSRPNVDDSAGSMATWDQDEQQQQQEDEKDKQLDQDHQAVHSAKVGIHRGDVAYKHLEGMDMDQMFARVTIFGTKPPSG